MPEIELQDTPEAIKESRAISIATTTFYPNFDSNDVDKLRGNLALRLIEEAISKGYSITIVDGGSQDTFIKKAVEIGAKVMPEEQKGMSGSRRQAIESASNQESAKVVCWIEPEKVSMIDCLALASKPILEGQADMVIPKRDKDALATYPDYQIEYEVKANSLWNSILKSQGLLDPKSEDLDAWFGPRIIKNDPELLSLFMDKYEFTPRSGKINKILKPELWPNAIFLPVVAALKKGYRVASVTVPYKHPAEQTAQEQDSPEFNRKRQVQLRNIITTTINFIRLLNKDSKSKLKVEP